METSDSARQAGRVSDGARQSAGGGRASIKAVAALAGVAPSSVSRVFSRHPNVSSELMTKVLKAASSVGYEPDMRAQSLRTGVTMTIGFLVSDISNPLFSEIALGAANTFRQAGYTMLLINSGGESSADVAALRLLRGRRIDALMASITSERSEDVRAELADTDIPIVMIDREPMNSKNVSAVLSDHAAGISSAAKLLLELGHRRIALVNGSMKVRPARERARALRDACRPFPDSVVIIRSGAFTVEHGQRATGDLLKAQPRPTAIIAGSNQILVGVMRSLRSAGLRIPDDISLVTCDAVGMSEFLDPPLANVRRDPVAMGSAAAELLLRQLQGGPAGRTILATRFEPTVSCGRAVAGGTRRKTANYKVLGEGERAAASATAPAPPHRRRSGYQNGGAGVN